jgi:hypothetical protein
MRKIKRYFSLTEDKSCFNIDERFVIYKIDGSIYDTKEGKDIPQWVYKLKDIFLPEFK